MGKYGKRRGRGFGKKNRAVPIAPLLPVAGVVLENWSSSGGVPKQFVYNMAKDTLGYDMTTGKMNLASALPFWGAEAVGIGFHMLASKPIRGKSLNSYIRRFTMQLVEF